jgi:hypothetical protein
MKRHYQIEPLEFPSPLRQRFVARFEDSNEEWELGIRRPRVVEFARESAVTLSS